MQNNTIVSQATPFGYSSVAVVRLSGDRSFSLAKKVSKTNNQVAHLQTTLLPVYGKAGKKIDMAVFTFFKGPKSYTGEDVVEISCHGNPMIVELLIENLVCLGARIAEPGEYTKRAYLNGKVSLSQAESVALLISSRSETAIYQNNKNIEGGTSSVVTKIKKGLLRALSTLEYELDVSEQEETTEQSIDEVVKLLNNNYLLIKGLLDSFKAGTAYTQGFRVVIIGKPNVGKSTLMNAITGLNRSITTSAPGTTRDTITSDLTLSGYPITLVDTAGLRETTDKTEAEGIQRTKDEIARSDLVLSVYTKDEEAVDYIEDRLHFTILNKVDIQKPKNIKKSTVCISALKGTGMDHLFSKLEESLSGLVSYSGDTFINTERQRVSANKCSKSIKDSLAELSGNQTNIEIAAHHTRGAINHIDSFLGKTTTDDILEKVFSDFCVGK